MKIPTEMYPLVNRYLCERMMGWRLVDGWIYEGLIGEFYQCKADIFERPMRR